MVLDLMWSCIPESRTSQAVLIGASVFFIVYQISKKRYRLPPGPWGLPLIGNILSLRKVPLFLKLNEWAKSYGPVMTVKLGPIRCVCLNRLDVIQEAFVKKSVEFAGRPNLCSLQTISEGYKDIIFTNYGPTWQLHRRLAVKALNFYMKGNRFEETVWEAVETSLTDLKKNKEAFDLQDHFKLLVFNILGIVCFDERFSLDDPEFKKFAENMDTGTEETGNGFWEDVIPPLRYWPTQKFQGLIQVVDETLAFINARVNQHRATFSKETKRDFTDAMLLAQQEAQQEENQELLEQITDVHISQTVSDIFQAGVDTSRQTLYWTFLFLVAYPEIQAKAHEELDRVLGDRKHVLMSDREHLPYTLAILYEAMRVSPVAPLTLPHTTVKDATVGEYEIPEGTMVMANTYAVHHDAKLWGDPLEFRPERFLDSCGKMGPKIEHWMPFSMGKRACLAESLAKPELHIILATLLKNLEFRVPEGTTADLEPKILGFAYLPKPYKVVVTDRSR